MQIRSRNINAANIEDVIKEIEETALQKIKDAGYVGHPTHVWPVPIDKQIEKLSLKWADPKSDCTGEVFYFELEDGDIF
jgi:hypothetical protein